MSKYQTLAEPSSGLYKEKGSKFIALAYPVENEAQIKVILSEIRKEYFDARHYCYAYRLGANGTTYRANDDGEPNHSAGDPILGQLKSVNLTNVLLVVVRYFGGIKLGVSGLVQAYKTAAQEALTAGKIIEKTEQSQLTIYFVYEQMNQVMSLVKELRLEVVNQKFTDKCQIVIQIPKTDESLIRSQFFKVTALQISG